MANDTNGLDDDYFAATAGVDPINPPDDTGNTDGQQPTNEQTTTVDQPSVDKAAPTQAQPTVQQPNQTEGQQQQQASQTPIQGLRKHASGEFVDQQGNITKADGTIIARSGSQRRGFEETYRIRNENQTYQREVQQLRQEVQSRQFLNGIPQQYGMTNEDVAQGLDYAARIKKGDFLGVARDFVALAASKGVQVSDILGKTAGDSIDMLAIRRMVEERTAPIVEQRQQATQDSEVMQAAQQNYNRFIADNEHADIHGDVIAAYAQTNGVSLQVAYNRTLQFAAQNGLDFANPLGPQIEALSQGQTQQQQPPTLPMPNGAATTHVSAVKPQQSVMADPNEDWGTIIRRSMQANQ